MPSIKKVLYNVKYDGATLKDSCGRLGNLATTRQGLWGTPISTVRHAQGVSMKEQSFHENVLALVHDAALNSIHVAAATVKNQPAAVIELQANEAPFILWLSCVRRRRRAARWLRPLGPTT